MGNRPLVCIATTTFNHKNFINKCIESVITQRTNFDYIMVIGDDCSTDGTREIIKQYENKYPNKIKVIYNKYNLGSKGSGGGRENLIKVLKYCKQLGCKYIALLDGDDYMLPNKLKIQVEFMESNPNIVLSAHNVYIVDENDSILKIKNNHKIKNILSINDLVKSGNKIIVTSSVIYRSEFIDIDFFEKNIKSTYGDFFLHCIVASHGKIGYIDKILGCYRRHSNSITQITSENIKNKINIKIEILQKVKLLFSIPDNIIRYAIANEYLDFAFLALKFNKIDIFKDYLTKSWNLFKGVSFKQIVLYMFKDFLFVFKIFYWIKFKLLRRNKNV